LSEYGMPYLVELVKKFPIKLCSKMKIKFFWAFFPNFDNPYDPYKKSENWPKRISLNLQKVIGIVSAGN